MSQPSAANATEHLFICYATEDWPLAEWLTRRLTAEGYRVWCDRFQLLGGESYPRDIDLAMKTRAFRVLALLSKASIDKPNPRKERTLAINIGKERNVDFLIPLTVDSLRATDLDWMTSDLTFIQFHPSWAQGLRQLLGKLRSIDAPRPLADGSQIAIDSFLPGNFLSHQPETLYSNHLAFLQLPAELLRVTLTRPMSPLEQQLATDTWAYHALSPWLLLAFTSPPASLLEANHATIDARISWSEVDQVEGVNAINVVSNLLNRSVLARYLARGLRSSADHRIVYFPPGLLEADKLFFHTYDGKMTWLLTTSERTYHRKGEVHRYRYHLSPRFRVRRDLTSQFVLQITPGLYLTDLGGYELPARMRNSRRKQLCRSWWNHQWLNRHFAVVSFLASGADTIVIGECPEGQIILSTRLNAMIAPMSLDEAALETWRASLPSSTAVFDEGGAIDDGEEPADEDGSPDE